MPLVTALDLPEFDYLDPTLRGTRFHDVLRELHQKSWLARSSFGYLVFDRRVVEHLLRDRSLASPLRDVLQLLGISDQAWLDWRLKGAVQAAVGADHSKLRQAVARAFTPKAVDRFRVFIRERVATLWQEIAPRGRCEFVADYARKLPAMAIAELLGLPTEYERLARWSTEMGRMYDLGDPDAPAAVIAATNEAHSFIVDILDDRSRDRGDDLLSVLARAGLEENRRLTSEECAMLAIDVIQAGTKTTAAQLGHMMRLFVEHPDQWKLLAKQPELARRATEEVLRFEPIAPLDPRMISHERDFKGVTFPAGSLVFACIATANRDPELFKNPDTFDIIAERQEEHFTFAPGLRYCLGASLARVEIEETIAFLPGRMRDPSPDGEMEFGSPTAGIYTMRAVPVSFTPQS
jgi:cytochrome P450